MSDSPFLSVEDLNAGYGHLEVLKGISLTVNRNEIVTLIGANGAGKSTTLMAISGVNRARHGTIRFNGEEIQTLSAPEIVMRGVAQVPEGRKIFPRMTVRENLELGAYHRTDALEIKRDIDKMCALFPILEQRISQPGGTLSGGEQQMLALARALMSRPKLLLLDEPSMGVAPLIAAKIFETLGKLRDEGMTILLVEQNAHLALKLASRGYVLETGKMILSDDSAKMLSNPRVREAYLGLT